MKILNVEINRSLRAFVVTAGGRAYSFPFAKCAPIPSAADPVVKAYVDWELANEAFTYQLQSGAEGSVHLERLLDYHKDPSYLRNILLYELTLEAQRRVAESPLSKREIIRRLGSSATQFYRILDQTNYSKSVDQVLFLLGVLECHVEFVVQAKNV